MPDFYIDPSKESFAELRSLPLDHPVEMLNLVLLNEVAEYKDGTVSSGVEAYAKYGAESAPIFKRVGGKIIWSGDPQHMVIGPTTERWDVAFIARYPTGEAFLNMVYDKEYQSIVYHRQAAVRTSRLIRMKPRDAGQGFG